MKRPVAYCACGTRTWTQSGICRDCAEDLSAPDGDSPNVLDESGWWNDRGIMRHIGRSA